MYYNLYGESIWTSSVFLPSSSFFFFLLFFFVVFVDSHTVPFYMVACSRDCDRDCT